MEWEKYESILSEDEIYELHKYENDKNLLMTYEQKIKGDLRVKMDLLLSISTDINNMPFDKGDIKLTTLDAAGTFFQNRIGLKSVEHFEIAFLDEDFNLLGVSTAFKGGLTSSLVDVRELIKESLQYETARYIMTAHNHPSGSVEESMDDIKLDARLKEAFEYIGMERLDNFIVSNQTYKSTVKDRKPIRIKDSCVQYDKSLGFINGRGAKILAQRGITQNLKLEEKISVLIDIEPNKLKDIFYKKEAVDFKRFLESQVVEKLQDIQEFAKDIRELLETENYREKIREAEDIVDKYVDLIYGLNNSQQIVLFLNTRMEIIQSDVVEWNGRDEEVRKAILKEVITKGIDNNTNACIFVKKTEESVYEEYRQIRSQIEIINRQLAMVGVRMLDYLVANKEAFYTNTGARAGVYSKKAEPIHKVYKQLIYKRGKQGLGLYDDKENFVGKKRGSKKEMQIIYGCPIKDPYGKLGRDR